MMKILKKDEKSEILIITPLLTGHQISKETKISLKRSDAPFIWASYEGTRKHAANVQAGLDAYKKEFGKLPPYIQILDRDIICGRNMIDRLWQQIKQLPGTIGFVYCPFEYKGHINLKFPPTDYNISRLLNGNYISSNSMYRSEVIEDVGGFVTEEDVHRMSDWAFFLKLYLHGYTGSLCSSTSFIAMSTAKDISAGSNMEYFETKRRIQERYISPILEHLHPIHPPVLEYQR